MTQLIHNVIDCRRGWIGSWKSEPLVYDELCPDDVGRFIIYRDFLHQKDMNRGKAEIGILTSWRNGTVFARYSQGDTSAGADACDVCFGISPIDGPGSKQEV